MTIQQLNAQKQALEQSLEKIDTQIAELTPKGNVTVMEWLQWAKENGFDFAQSAIDQCGGNKQRLVYSLSEAILGFGHWETTKEGFGYWYKIHDTLCSEQK